MVVLFVLLTVNNALLFYCSSAKKEMILIDFAEKLYECQSVIVVDK